MAAPHRTKKCLFVIVALVLMLAPTLAEDWTTSNGKIYRGIKVIRHDSITVTILFEDGGATINLADLPSDIQKKYGFDPKAAAVAKAQEDAQAAADLKAKLDADAKAAALKGQQDAQAAADAKAQAAAQLEEERAKQEALDLTEMHTKDGKIYHNYVITFFGADGVELFDSQYQTAHVDYVNMPESLQKLYAPDPKSKQWEEEEKQDENKMLATIAPAAAKAADDYTSAAKITVTGQVFIVTKGGDNIKLGGVHVLLYPEDELTTIVTSRKAYCEKQVEYLQPTADKATERSEAAAAKIKDLDIMSDDYSKLSGQNNTANSFYLYVLNEQSELLSSYQILYGLPASLADAETDADGKFSIAIPSTGNFALVCHSSRSIGDSKEDYYWTVRLQMNGESSKSILLNNENLTVSGSADSVLQAQQ